MISGDFLTRWNAIAVRKEREKGQFLVISYFWIEVLGLLPYEGTTFIANKTFQLKARLYLNFIAVRKYNFLDYFLFSFSVQNLCCNDSKYHSLNWKDVSVTNVDVIEKKQFSLQFLHV